MAKKQLVPIDMDGKKIINLADPTADQDAATKAYVDTNAGSDVPYVGTTAPSSPEDGMLWWDPDDNTSPTAMTGNSLVMKEVPTGTINGTNDTFYTLDSYLPGTLIVYINGENATGDVTEINPSTGQFFMDQTNYAVPNVGDDFFVMYQHASNATGANAETVNGIRASGTPQPDKLVPLDATGHFSPLVKKAAAVSLGLTGSPTIANGSPSVVSWTQAIFDPLDMWDNAQPTRITIPTGYSGIWQITGWIHFDGATGFIRSWIYKNGSEYTYELKERSGGNLSPVRVSILMQLNEGDYVELYGDHGAAGPLSIFQENSGGAARSRFEAVWQGAV